MKADSTAFDPKYELLSISKEELPEGFEDYAGLHVIRDTDEAELLYFTNMGDGSSALVKDGELMGQKVPAELLEKITAQDLDYCATSKSDTAKARVQRTQARRFLDGLGQQWPDQLSLQSALAGGVTVTTRHH